MNITVFAANPDTPTSHSSHSLPVPAAEASRIDANSSNLDPEPEGSDVEVTSKIPQVEVDLEPASIRNELPEQTSMGSQIQAVLPNVQELSSHGPRFRALPRDVEACASKFVPSKPGATQHCTEKPRCATRGVQCAQSP